MVALAAAGGGWLLVRGDDTAAAAQPTTATVSTTTLQDTITASGTLAAADSAEDSFAVSGTVTEVLVEAGDVVSAGQALATVDDTTLQAELTAAESSLAAAQESYDEVSGSDVQVAAAASQVTQAEAALGEAQDAVDGATLRASIPGTVTAVGYEVGDSVGSSGSSGSSDSGSSGSGGTGATGGSAAGGASSSSGTSSSTDAAVSIVSTGTFIVEASVSADEVSRISEGLQVELSATDVADAVYGTVTDVAVLPDVDDSGAAAFGVTVGVTGVRDDLYAGVSVDLSIIVSQRADVLTVSTAAVQTDDDGATYVERVTATDDDGAPTATERVDIEIGEVSGSVTEVISGLDDGDVVEVPGVSLPNTDGESGQVPGGDGGQIPGGGQMPEGGMPQGDFGGGGR